MTNRIIPRATTCVLVILSALALAACAGESSSGGDPGARAMAPGQNCQGVRGELNKLQARGVTGKVEAASTGRKLSPADKAEVDRYNLLLEQYLGARCHV